jgi:hypothetical protein
MTDSSNDSITYYQWFRDGKPIASATEAYYNIRPDDIDHDISVGSTNDPSVRIKPGVHSSRLSDRQPMKWIVK